MTIERSEYEELARDNYGLVISFMNNRGLNIDEWHYEVSRAYMNALRKYDSSKGKLSTYFYFIASNHVNKVKSNMYKIADKKGQPKYMSELNEINDVGSYDCYGLDQIGWLSILDDFELSIVKLMNEGYSQVEISEILSVPGGTVNSSVHRLRKKLMKEGIKC